MVSNLAAIKKTKSFKAISLGILRPESLMQHASETEHGVCALTLPEKFHWRVLLKDNIYVTNNLLIVQNYTLKVTGIIDVLGGYHSKH